MSWRNNIFFRYIKSIAVNIVMCLVTAAVFSVICVLWSYDIRAVAYSLVLCAAIATVPFFIGYYSFKSRVKQLEGIIGDYDTACERLPREKSGAEREWHEIVCSMFTEMKKREREAEEKLKTAENYYTAWAHQVKVPISAIHLILAEAEDRTRRDVGAELTRIEQYTDMIMAYVRLDSSSTDYVFREVSLDNVIKSVIRKYSGMFIRKKLTISFEDSSEKVLGDEKWISFILEQLLSNALKYTNRGGIKINVQNGVVSVSDTGIGIAKEDIPRIFEKGFTGINGRTSGVSSGIGLYLIRRVCSEMGYSLSVESEQGEGSMFTVDFSRSDINPND